MNIRVDDLTGSKIQELLSLHVENAVLNSPETSVHALDLDGLRSKEITFWSVWDGPSGHAMLMGCAALKELANDHGEIKSMHTAVASRGKGVGQFVVKHLVEESRRRSYRRLSLETGSSDVFAPARRLYLRCGFSYCEPFAHYKLDPHSVFMTMDPGQVE